MAAKETRGTSAVLLDKGGNGAGDVIQQGRERQETLLEAFCFFCLWLKKILSTSFKSQGGKKKVWFLHNQDPLYV